MMTKYFLLLLLAFSFSSCLSANRKALEDEGAIKTEPSTDPNYDYAVLMEGVNHMGYNANDAKDREKMLKSMFKDKCKSIAIGDVLFADTGSIQDNKKVPTWAMKVKCLN